MQGRVTTGVLDVHEGLREGREEGHQIEGALQAGQVQGGVTCGGPRVDIR